MNVIYSYAALLRAVVMSQESAHCWLSWELTSKFLNMMGLLLPGKLREGHKARGGRDERLYLIYLLVGWPSPPISGDFSWLAT